ncbi:hypothetical protein Clacol_004122 [Clathrus columnatus]|uniref:WD repeat-containing protein 75 second beta-propeller domain-containing protein n=1 Tax=Clathrus columnatus TaxID=1419009 RepID=A0AAV5AB97_9AGAM|nr:hypothetical protein Clacol_004122 [Clathrus columnatus]
MEVGTSQMATTENSSAPLIPRKPRHKHLKRLQKGKEKEQETLEVTHTPQSKPTEPSSSKPPLEDDDNIKKSASWSWALLTDSSVSSRPPLFTKDYSSSTGPSSSQDVGHSAEITSILINPQNTFQLISSSLDGCIKIWDYLEAVLLSTFNFKQPITHMCAHDRQPNYVFITTTSFDSVKSHEDNNNQEISKVYRILLRPTKVTADLPVQTPVEKLKIGKVRNPTGLAVSPSGEWLVAIGGPKAYVCPMSSLQAGFTKFISNEPLTCLAFHPTQEYFATGDKKGQIRLWYCLDSSLVASSKNVDNDKEKHAQTTMLHWHAHAVSSLAFSSNGAYLLSGGEEAVLVVWQLHTGKKEYVPRVGSPIVSIAVACHENGEEEYLLALLDGTLATIGSTSLRISKSFASLKHDSTLWGTGPAPLAIHTLTSTVILPSSHPSSLLVHSPSTSTAVAELEISPTNRVSRRDDKQILPLRVERVVISHNGQWMATVDGRPDTADFAREVYLKFWRWDAASSTWNLNSRIDRPHGAQVVSGMEFIPSYAGAGPYLVTCGGDRNVKTWRIKSITSKAGQEEFWVCRSTFGYRSKMPSNIVGSPDGSLIAVSYDLYAVLYDTASNRIRSTLTCPDLRDVWHMAFIGESGQYFVITDNRMVHVWDLVASTVRWQYLVPHTIYSVIPHPKEDSFVVLFADQDQLTCIYKFMASSSSIKFSRTLPFKLKKVLWYPFGVTRKDFSLVGITYDWTAVVFGDRVNINQGEGASANGIGGDIVPQRRSLFQDMFGATAFDDLLSQAPLPASTPVAGVHHDSVSKTSNIFNVSSYQLSPMSTLYPSILENLLKERVFEPVTEKDGEEVDRPDDGDVQMADEHVPETTRTPERINSSQEIEELVELFKGEAFCASKSAISSYKHLNGNGSVKGTNGVNHVTQKSSTPHKMVNGKHHVEEEIDEVETPASIGKKRKKKT